MRGLLTAMLALATLVAVTIPIARAQSLDDPPPGTTGSGGAASSVRMEVNAGFEGAGRLGGWIPLEIELVNEGAEVRAEVQVVVAQTGGRSTFTSVPTTFTLPVVLPRLSQKRFTMEVNLPSVNNRMTARLVSPGSNTVLVEREIAMARVPLGDYFCGVLARDPSSYDFLAALDLPPPIRRVRLAGLEPATVPSRAQLLGSFDCIIVDNAATGQLRQEQLDALQVWVGTGGLLLAVGGATWQSTLGPLPADLLPVDVTGLSSSPSLSALGELMENPIDTTGPFLLSQARPKVDRGARVVASQDGTPLIVAAKRGEGTVMYLAYEPTSRSIRSWAGNEAMWRYLITHASVDNGVGSALVRPYLRWGRIPRLAMADFSAHAKPNLDWLWGVTGLYVAGLVGSLSVFGRRGKVGTAFLSVVGLTALTSLVTFSLARDRSEADLAVTRVSIVRPIDVGESQAAYTREYISALAKKPGEFNVQLADDALARGLFYPFPRPADESDVSWQFRVAEGSTPMLDRLQLKQGQLATVVTDGQLRRAPGVVADLRVEYDTLTGTLTNRTGGRLTDAVLVVDSLFSPLGTLERDQQRQIDAVLPRQASAGNLAAAQIADRITGQASAARTGSVARRDWIESLFAARFLFGRMELRGPTLVGWLEGSPNALQAPGFKLSTVDYTLLVQPLQPMLPRGFEGEVPAAAMNRRDLGIGSGVATDREYYSLAPGEAITLQFTLPPADGRFQVRELRVNLEGQLGFRRGTPQPPFTVQLYNWRAAEWRAWEVVRGSSIVPEGDRYISAAGDIRMRYVLDSGLNSVVREARINRLDVTPIGTVR